MLAIHCCCVVEPALGAKESIQCFLPITESWVTVPKLQSWMWKILQSPVRTSNKIRRQRNMDDIFYQNGIFGKWISFLFHLFQVFSSFLFLMSALWSQDKYKYIWVPLPIWLFITYLKLRYSLIGYKLIPGRSQEKVIFLMVYKVCQFLLTGLKGQAVWWLCSKKAVAVWMRYVSLYIDLCIWTLVGGVWGSYGTFRRFSLDGRCHWRKALRVYDITHLISSSVCFLCADERNQQLAWGPVAVPSSPLWTLPLEPKAKRNPTICSFWSQYFITVTKE